MHKKKAGKLQTGSTFPKQYWLAVNGKPKRVMLMRYRATVVWHLSFQFIHSFSTTATTLFSIQAMLPENIHFFSYKVNKTALYFKRLTVGHFSALVDN